MRIRVVVLSGGQGERLWPLSHHLYPKQFQNLIDEYSLLQNTLKNAQELGTDKNIVICHENHRYTAEVDALGTAKILIAIKDLKIMRVFTKPLHQNCMVAF